MAISKLSELQSRFHNYSLEKKAFPTPLVQSLVQSMEERGISSDDSLAGTDINLSSERVTYKQRIHQLSNMLDLVGMDGAWLESPRTASISDYGLLGYAMMSSATLEQAVQIAVKYHKTAGAMFELVFDVDGDINYGDLDKHDVQLRPHVVLFGEYPWHWKAASDALKDCELLIVVGTSFSIHYIGPMVASVKHDCKVFYVDPKPDLQINTLKLEDLTVLREKATTGVRKIVNVVLDD